MTILEQAEAEFLSRKATGTLPSDLPRGQNGILDGIRMLLVRGDRLLAIHICCRIAASSGLQILREFGENEAVNLIEKIR